MIKLQGKIADERIYNTRDVSVMLHIKPNTVSVLCDTHEIVGAHKTPRGWQIPESAVKTFMLDRGIPYNIARQKIYTPTDVANIIGVSPRTARDLYDNRMLGGYKLWKNVEKPKQRRYIPQSELIKFIQENNISSEEARALEYSPLPVNDRLEPSSLAPILMISDEVYNPVFELIGFDRNVDFVSGVYSAKMKLANNKYAALILDERGEEREALAESAKAVERMHRDQPNLNIVAIVDDVSQRGAFSASGATTLTAEKMDLLPGLLAESVHEQVANGLVAPSVSVTPPTGFGGR